MKIAIVHDYLNQYGGAERVVEVLHELFPEAPVYTSVYLPSEMPGSFKKMDIRTSFMQGFPWMKRHFKKYLMFFPRAIESFDFTGYDLILSSSSGWAKAAKHDAHCLHLCYCYTPMRWVWSYQRYIERENIPWWAELILKVFIRQLKKWDLETSSRVDRFIAISKLIQDRIKNSYHRDSVIIYPPVETNRFSITEQLGDYYLLVSRLNTYKRVDIVVQAFNQLGLPLVVIGEGPDKAHLEKIAKQNIRFLGKVADPVVNEHCAKCQAFIFPGEEDFGIAPVEAMASGRPVVAYAAGGALETVSAGVTGVFFEEQTPMAIVAAVKEMQSIAFDSGRIRKHAQQFDKEIFKQKLKNYIEKEYAEFKNKQEK
ncbi:MAG: glycosyltransferase [bacterium]|nr:glycosyltransferase [bacterium]